ncbi:MAG: hypothetical protein H7839_17210 [Magnetococcus sp. YQC-5]
MNINLNKRKLSSRWAGGFRLTGERHGERSRPSVLANQKVQKRLRGKTELRVVQAPEQTVDNLRNERTPTVNKEITRRRSSATFSHPLGVRLLEGGVVLAAGLSLIIKNGISQIAGWIREGRDIVKGSDTDIRYAWHDDAHHEENEEGIWDGHDCEEESNVATQSACDQNSSVNPDHSPQLLAQESDLDQTLSPLRKEVEFIKVQMLDAEENGIPDEELDDQAGALRARISESARHM